MIAEKDDRKETVTEMPLLLSVRIKLLNQAEKRGHTEEKKRVR